jgi:nicotinamide riboside kinase
MSNKKTYRIGLCGTMSVGKTTLVKALQELPTFKEYKVATERSKYLSDLGIPLNTDSTLEGQFIFMAERASELLQEKIITDRTVYDVCAFTLSAKSINWLDKVNFVRTAMSLTQKYDVIFYVSPEGVEIEDNGVRTTDPIFRDKIDQIIQETLKEYPPQKLVTLKGSTEERIKQIKEVLFS